MPIDVFDVHHGSTTHLAEGLGTYASRAVIIGGSAVLRVAQKFKSEIERCLAKAAGRSSELTPLLLALLAQEVGKGGRTVDVEAVFENATLTYTSGAHAAYVAVDPCTGHVEVLDYVAIEDVGHAINPALVHGQAIGGVVQGDFGQSYSGAGSLGGSHGEAGGRKDGSAR